MKRGMVSRRHALVGLATIGAVAGLGHRASAFVGGGGAAGGALQFGDDRSAADPPTDVSAGLKEALRVGTDKVVDQLGTTGGFLNDSAVRIPLPPGLDQAQAALNTIGMSALADDLEIKLNQAAEAATPKARAIFVDAINDITLEDAAAILDGSDDAATQYFRTKMSPRLKDEMRPVIDGSLANVGAIQAYDAMMLQYDAIPFMPDAKAELTDYGLDKTLDGLFYYVAEQERAIRTDPAARTSDLLRQVFGS